MQQKSSSIDKTRDSQPADSSPHRRRINKLRDRLASKKIDAFITFNYENIRYLSGFSGSSAVVIITLQEAFFLTDFRYKVQAGKEVTDLKITIYKKQRHSLKELINSLPLKSIAFESPHLSYSLYEKIRNTINCDALIPENDLVEDIRIIKEKEEIRLIKKSIAIAVRGYTELQKNIVQGAKELDVAVNLEYMLRKNGSEIIPFSPIAASGARSSMPHAAPGQKILMNKDLLVIDFGARYNGYNSDMTRTSIIGDIEKRQEEIYTIVLRANKEAIAAVKPGVTASSIDMAARDLIAKEGYKDFFGHGTGHGVGLAVHENPKIRWDDDTILQEGMVFTIEPGIYIPDFGGVRIEDMVIVTKDGCELLTRSLSKEL